MGVSNWDVIKLEDCGRYGVQGAGLGLESVKGKGPIRFGKGQALYPVFGVKERDTLRQAHKLGKQKIGRLSKTVKIHDSTASSLVENSILARTNTDFIQTYCTASYAMTKTGAKKYLKVCDRPHRCARHAHAIHDCAYLLLLVQPKYHSTIPDSHSRIATTSCWRS